MLYYRCPTCRTILANKQLLYEQELARICDDNKMTEEEKNKEKMQILDKLFIKNICCRMRTLGYLRKIEIIK